MPALCRTEAAEKLARVVERAEGGELAEIYAELFPERAVPASLAASDLARHVRRDLEAEEIVDLWNVVFPADRNVWYDEESDALHYNEEMAGYAD